MFAKLSNKPLLENVVSTYVDLSTDKVGDMMQWYYLFLFCDIFFVFLHPAVAEVGDPPGAPRLSVLPGLGDGSGRDGLLSHAGHQPM